MEEDILKFYIIHIPSGLCIFQQTFKEFPVQVEPEIIAGYLFAITTLSMEIAKEPIHFMQLKNLRFS